MDAPQKSDAELLLDLPPVIREIIERSEWQTQLRKIVTQRHFRVDQGAFLEEAILRFIVGEETAEELAAAMASELKLDNDQLRDVLSQLDREIFVPMKAELEKHIAETDGDEGEVAPAAPSAPGRPSPYSAAAPAKPASAPMAVPDDSDDLEALINAGDDILAPKVAAPVSMRPPIVATPAPMAAPATPIAVPAAAPAANPMASVAEKLAAPVISAAEISNSTPVKPQSSAPAAGAAASTDPYREPLR